MECLLLKQTLSSVDSLAYLMQEIAPSTCEEASANDMHMQTYLRQFMEVSERCFA